MVLALELVQHQKSGQIMKFRVSAQWNQCKNNFFIAILQFGFTTQNFWVKRVFKIKKDGKLLKPLG